MDRTKKLYRSRTDRMLGGVCGGLAEYFGVDVTLVRIAFIILSVIGGTGVPIYLAMWLIVPKQPEITPA
jgi:phage shock protein C